MSCHGLSHAPGAVCDNCGDCITQPAARPARPAAAVASSLPHRFACWNAGDVVVQILVGQMGGNFSMSNGLRIFRWRRRRLVWWWTAQTRPSLWLAAAAAGPTAVKVGIARGSIPASSPLQWVSPLELLGVIMLAVPAEQAAVLEQRAAAEAALPAAGAGFSGTGSTGPYGGGPGSSFLSGGQGGVNTIYYGSAVINIAGGFWRWCRRRTALQLRSRLRRRRRLHLWRWRQLKYGRRGRRGRQLHSPWRRECARRRPQLRTRLREHQLHGLSSVNVWYSLTELEMTRAVAARGACITNAALYVQSGVCILPLRLPSNALRIRQLASSPPFSMC